MDASRLGAREAATRIAEGRLTAVALTEACLARIETREPEVNAWAYLDPDVTLAQAHACDARGPTSPLYGVPVGVKDIIDTTDMPTEYGSPIYRNHRSPTDADCVACVRAAGGVILGKTVTTEFAFRHPFSKTCNPQNSAHTPGGSSSGSAVAVADFMVPLAFGTQTGGSIIRPASYCGIYGYKPTFNTFSSRGIKPLAPGLDTLGHFARNLDDIAWLAAALSDGLSADIPSWSGLALRIGLARLPDWAQAETATVNAVESAAMRLGNENAQVTELDPPDKFVDLGTVHKTIMHVEAVSALDWEHKNHADKLSAELREILEHAAMIPAADYDKAVAHAVKCRTSIDELFAGNDVLLAASAPGEAPAGLDFTGDPIFNGLWTLLHVPCVTIPFSKGANQLPVGIQVIGRPGDDIRLLSAAKWIVTRLDV
ncbi:MAG: amidase [Acidiferrobacterales bacterium]